MTCPYPKHPMARDAEVVVPTCTNCRAVPMRSVPIRDTPVVVKRKCGQCGAKYRVKTAWFPMDAIKLMVVRTEIEMTAAASGEEK